jgi:hypothetical protein
MMDFVSVAVIRIGNFAPFSQTAPHGWTKGPSAQEGVKRSTRLLVLQRKVHRGAKTETMK